MSKRDGDSNSLQRPAPRVARPPTQTLAQWRRWQEQSRSGKWQSLCHQELLGQALTKQDFCPVNPEVAGSSPVEPAIKSRGSEGRWPVAPLTYPEPTEFSVSEFRPPASSGRAQAAMPSHRPP